MNVKILKSALPRLGKVWCWLKGVFSVLLRHVMELLVLLLNIIFSKACSLFIYLRTSVIDAVGWIRGAGFSERCYAAATFLMLAMVFARVEGEYVIFIAMGLYVVGFVGWLYTHIASLWSNPLFKVVINLSSALVALIALTLSRHLVAGAVELPVDDFSLAISFCAIPMYLPIWLALIAILCLLYSSLTILATPFAPMKKFHVFMGHVVGAYMAGLALMSVVEFCHKNAEKLNPVVHWVVALSEYTEAGKYPGIPQGHAVKLHKNGVVSFVRIKDDRVSFEVVPRIEGLPFP